MERKDTRKTSWTKVASVDAKSPLSCTAQKLLEDVPYLFRVIAVNEEGQSPPLEADKEIVPKAPAGKWKFFKGTASILLNKDYIVNLEILK